MPNNPSKLEELKLSAECIVLEVSNNINERYDLRVDFYKKYGHPIIKGKEGLGDSELAFMKWEMKRGVLNPLFDKSPGSPWWRDVNSYFIYLSTLAALIFESKEDFKDLDTPVVNWLSYLKNPNEVTWYRAHNSSIISGYQKALSDASKESDAEQTFMNIVLYRLLYAQSMVEGVSFGILGKIFSNPRGDAVGIITDIESFYPSHYPLSKEDIKYVNHKAHNLEGLAEDFFDEILILPELKKLYKEAANWNSMPILESYINSKGKPCYPNSN